jgi:RNA polymerase sigma factor (TIGR02999 family)
MAPRKTPEEREFDSLLEAWGNGDHAAGERLVEIAYGELRRIARRIFRGESPGHTLQPTAIANLACMKMLRSDPSRFNDRDHFFSVAAIQMRNILIDHRRSRPVDKRIGKRIPVEEIELAEGSRLVDLLTLEQALTRLAEISPRASRIVRLRYICGLSEEETAEALDISVTTLKRDWKFAKGHLAAQLGGGRGRIRLESPLLTRQSAPLNPPVL